MEDPRGAQGVEHLQAAARELLLAARSFLDVVEDVVEDRDRLAGAASGVVDLLRDGLSGAMPSTSPLEPWERVAWGAEPEGATPADEPAEESAETGESNVTEEPAPVAARTAPATKAPAKKAPAKKAPAKKAPAKKAPTAEAPGAAPRRVRRIAVD